MKMQLGIGSWRSALAVACCFGAAGAAFAQQPAPPHQQPPAEAKPAETKPAETQPAAEQPVVRGLAVRASQIQGMEVRNPAKEELGTVEDLVIDLQQGRVEYAALSFGGFAGIGNKLFAVPWDTLKAQADLKGVHLVANLDEKKLETAPGFDKDHWPQLADRKWHANVRQFYRGEAPRTTPQAEAEKPAPDQSHAKLMMMRCNDLLGMQVRNSQGADLGDINDVVIDLDSGKVRFAAISFGGFLGIGDKLFAIPWDMVRFDQRDGETFAVVDLSKERLETAPGFDKQHWPDVANPTWHADVDKYYQTERDAHRQNSRE